MYICLVTISLKQWPFASCDCLWTNGLLVSFITLVWVCNLFNKNRKWSLKVFIKQKTLIQYLIKTKTADFEKVYKRCLLSALELVLILKIDFGLTCTDEKFIIVTNDLCMIARLCRQVDARVMAHLVHMAIIVYFNNNFQETQASKQTNRRGISAKKSTFF